MLKTFQILPVTVKKTLLDQLVKQKSLAQQTHVKTLVSVQTTLIFHHTHVIAQKHILEQIVKL
jgi:hypothetical protein